MQKPCVPILEGIASITSSSRGENWDGVTIDRMTTVPEAVIPGYDHHLVALHTAGTCSVLKQSGGVEHRGVKSPGSLTVIPAGAQSYWCADVSTQSAAIWIPPNLLTDAAAAMDAPHAAVELRDVFDARDPVLEQLATIMLSELDKPRHPAQKLIHDAASLAFTAHLLRAFDLRSSPEPKVPRGLPPRALGNVIAYIEDHLGEAIELIDLARIGNVSRFHFIKLFKMSTGMSPMAYVERSRIRRAARLIKHGEMRLTEIAVAVGFADQSHFTRRFRRHTGYTPGSFRRERSLASGTAS